MSIPESSALRPEPGLSIRGRQADALGSGESAERGGDASRSSGSIRHPKAVRLILGGAAVLALMVFAGRTFDQVRESISPSQRAMAADLRGTYLCLEAALRELPADETYWFGPATNDSVREMWRQRALQRSFPHLKLADREDQATMAVGIESTGDGGGCSGYRIAVTPISRGT